MSPFESTANNSCTGLCRHKPPTNNQPEANAMKLSKRSNHANNFNWFYGMGPHWSTTPALWIWTGSKFMVIRVSGGYCPPPGGSTKPQRRLEHGKIFAWSIDADRVLDQGMFVRAIFWHSVEEIKSKVFKGMKLLCKGSHAKMQKTPSCDEQTRLDSTFSNPPLSW